MSQRFSSAMKSRFEVGIVFALVVGLASCVGPRPGPDKQGEGMLLGAATGAGAGAVTGAQIASTTGPGIVIGAGFGAVAGSIRGAMQDEFEMELMRLSQELRQERERAFAHEFLADHYDRRRELHPKRDIFPSDIFFRSDEVELRPTATPILRELIRIHQDRFGWSRFSIFSYVKSADDKNAYAKYLAERRAEALGNELTKLGVEARRIRVHGVLVEEPVLTDPLDHPLRYAAAIEFAPIDTF
ncbi:MAG: OmpA family protein [Bdellovibrionales bacterium]|nr:OmpA family protein [Bdellovibrionales bacterium]